MKMLRVWKSLIFSVVVKCRLYSITYPSLNLSEMTDESDTGTFGFPFHVMLDSIQL